MLYSLIMPKKEKQKLKKRMRDSRKTLIRNCMMSHLIGEVEVRFMSYFVLMYVT